MRDRQYYSVRTGKNQILVKFDLETFRKLFFSLYLDFERRNYFQEAFGYECVDDGSVVGTIGEYIESYMLQKIRKPDLWPIDHRIPSYSEDDLFDVIEFLYDHISKPVKGRYHDYAGCGWHYSKFDREAGRDEYRQKINDLLRDYSSGYELTDDGEILNLPEHGFDALLDASLPASDPEKVEARVNAAIHKFRSRHSTSEDRRDAIRDLADVLEYLRPKVKEVLTRKDDADLFNIANNFEIRHHNEDQKSDYDKPIWYSWMFYFYLATIHAALRLIQKNEDN